MMWNWLVTALGSGAAIVLYDGSPFVPSPNALWDLVDELGYLRIMVYMYFYALVCNALLQKDVYHTHTHAHTHTHTHTHACIHTHTHTHIHTHTHTHTHCIHSHMSCWSCRITYFGAGAKYYDMLDEKNIEISE